MQIDVEAARQGGQSCEDRCTPVSAVLNGRSSFCERCSTLPAIASAQAGERVLVYAPAPPALGKVRLAATESGYAVTPLDEAIVLLNGPAGDWGALLNALESRLSALEAGETRVVPLGATDATSTGVMLAALKARSVPTLLAEVRDGWLREAIKADRLTSYFQPIVDVASGEIFAHEALLRATLDDG